MALELLFTSAVQGLKSGSQGYCTVQCTQAMPGPLAERLEALSAYRPIYPSQSEQAKLNPVNVAYWRIRAVGKTFPVLSRIADYGLDYSQRTNKLAHHLVIEPSEMSVEGPAAIAAAGSAFVTQWNQKVESIQQPRRLPVAASSMGVCRHWQNVMGDAGWAGVVAEEIIKDQKQPIFLIYEPGQEVLPLIVEVQSLLPPALRWKSTFSTYLTYLPPEAECQIRCLLKGSKEAHESLRHVNSLRIDLTQPKSAPSGPLVDAARTGVMPVQVKKPEAATPFDYEIDEEPPALPSHRGVAAETLQLQVDENGRRPGPRGRRKQYSAAPVLPQKRGMGLYIAGGVSVLVLSLVGGVVAMQFLKPGKEKPKGSVENVVQVETPVISEPEVSAAAVSEPIGSTIVDSPKEGTSITAMDGSQTESLDKESNTSPKMDSNIGDEGSTRPAEVGMNSEEGKTEALSSIFYSKEAWNQQSQDVVLGVKTNDPNPKIQTILFPVSNKNESDAVTPPVLMFESNSIKTVPIGENKKGSNLFDLNLRNGVLGISSNKPITDERIPLTLLFAVAVLNDDGQPTFVSLLPPAEYEIRGSVNSTGFIQDLQDLMLKSLLSSPSLTKTWSLLRQTIQADSLKLKLPTVKVELPLEITKNLSELEFIPTGVGNIMGFYNSNVSNQRIIGLFNAIGRRQNGGVFNAMSIDNPKWAVRVHPTHVEVKLDERFKNNVLNEIKHLEQELAKELYSVQLPTEGPEEFLGKVRELEAARKELLSAMTENKKILETIRDDSVIVTGTIKYTVVDPVENKPIQVDFIRFKEPQQ